MRMRKKKNLPARMARAAALLVTEPESLRGRWAQLVPGCGAVQVELGCGKGLFTAATARDNPDTLLVAIERVPDAMVVGMERCMAGQIHNVRFVDMDAARLREVFAPGEITRIYINFCDPWPSNRHAKRRLTSPTFLPDYRALLCPGGEIHMKTDNVPLFRYSGEQFAAAGFTLYEQTEDLHRDGVQGNMTDYERKFYGEGKPICRVVARVEDGQCD